MKQPMHKEIRSALNRLNNFKTLNKAPGVCKKINKTKKGGVCEPFHTNN